MKCLDFIQLFCTHEFSRINFAAELSINLVYNSIFVKLLYIFFQLLFFFKMKLSVFSRLFKTQNRDDQVTTLRYRNSTLIKKKSAGIGLVSADTLNFWDRIGSEKKNGICASLIVIKCFWMF